MSSPTTLFKLGSGPRADASTIGGSAGTLPFDAALGIPRAAWESLPRKAQQKALNAGKFRAQLRAVDVLQKLATLDDSELVTQAEHLGIKVLLADPTGALALGLIDVPELSAAVVHNPRGFEVERGQPGKILLVPDRLRLMREFVSALVTKQREAGVLLTGPRGTGKSGVGRLSYMVSAALQLLVVYLPVASPWVVAAQGERVAGDTYFLEHFVLQNADLIAANPKLLPIFLPFFCAQEEEWKIANLQSVGDDTISFLTSLMRTEVDVGIGVIVDEVQAITKVMEDPKTHADRDAASYFRPRWYNWLVEPGRLLVRMDIASSHGSRELELPSGEDVRLRYVGPWTANVADALLTAKESPGYIADDKMRESIKFAAGGVVRRLMAGKELADATNGDVAAVEHELRQAMADDAEHYFSKLTSEERLQARDLYVPLVQGKVSWMVVKGLYDAGLVARIGKMHFVRPVSPIAASVLHSEFAKIVNSRETPWDKLVGWHRGLALKEHIFAALDPCNVQVHTRDMETGNFGPMLLLHADYMLPMVTVADTTVPRDAAVVYRSTDPNSAVDIVMVPPSGDAYKALPVLALECSVTHLPVSMRVDKLKQQALKHMIEALKVAHRDRAVVLVLCVDESFVKPEPTAPMYREVMGYLAGLGVEVRVMDIGCLQELGTGLRRLTMPKQLY